MTMNTNTIRALGQVRDDEQIANELDALVANTPRNALPAQVLEALERYLTGNEETLDLSFIEWEALVHQVILDRVPLPDELLPHLLIALLDARTWIEEECAEQLLRSDLPARSARDVIDRFVQRWRRDIPLSWADLKQRCRSAPRHKLLVALVAQHEALRAASLQAGDNPFWNEGGQGYAAYTLGSQEIDSTWWSMYAPLRAWADEEKDAIQAVLSGAISALQHETASAEVTGVLEPMLVTLRSLYMRVFGE